MCVHRSDVTYSAKEHFRKIWSQEAASSLPLYDSQLVGIFGSVVQMPHGQPLLPQQVSPSPQQQQTPKSPRLRQSESHVSAGGTGAGDGGTSGALLALRGLRVRMGMSCGFEAGDIELNKTTSRFQYSGYQSTVARAVSDAAQVCAGATRRGRGGGAAEEGRRVLALSAFGEGLGIEELGDSTFYILRHTFVIG